MSGTRQEAGLLSAEVDAVAVETGIVDTPGFGPLEQDLATVIHNCRRYPASTTEYGFLSCYDGEYDEELLQRLVRLQDVSSIIWLASMHGTKLRALDEVQHRLDTLDTSHRWHQT